MARLQQQAAEAQRGSNAELVELKELVKQQGARYSSEITAMATRLGRTEAKLAAIEKDDSQLAAKMQLELQPL